jgi:hypothetical protein
METKNEVLNRLSTEIILKVDRKKINETLTKVREFKDIYLMWLVEKESPADCPEDILWFLETFSDLDKHFVSIIHGICERNDNIE